MDDILTSQQYAAIQRELCPRCHSANLIEGELNERTQHAERECLECGATWTAFFIIESVYHRAGYEHFEGNDNNPYFPKRKELK